MPRDQVLNKKMRDDRKEHILRSALKLFVTKGLAGTKIRDISGAADMSLGLLYHYYDSKEAVYTDLIHSAYEKLNAAAIAIETMPLSPRKKIKMFIEAFLKDLNEDEAFGWYCLLIAQASITPDIPSDAKRIIGREDKIAYEVLESIIKEGQRDGSFKQYYAKEMSLMFWTLIRGFAIKKAASEEKFIVPDDTIISRIFL
jgi:TetR/AcrR family transcriptional regulator